MSAGDLENPNHLLNQDEQKEWQQALEVVARFQGTPYAKALLAALNAYATNKGLGSAASFNTPYMNTLSAEEKAVLPDDAQLMDHLTNIMRWDAIAMVMRAGERAKELGGHIASYAASATLYEVGFTYFFRADSEEQGGDSIYIQGHSSPGIYARAFLEGRFTEDQLDHFRQEVGGRGISSYPHPWLMPNFWQFATVSMGLGPLMAIYQAQFLKYLQHRSLSNTEGRKVWAFCGDGEMGEVESLGALNIAGRERLDNLIFVISCNLQRLDGPVWGDGQIIQEYERVFLGAGWHVIKVIWGEGWENLFQRDHTGILLKRISELVDGEYQAYSSRDGAYFRKRFFGKYPELAKLVEHLSDEALKSLRDGGHDVKEVYAAYHAAVHHRGQPTVILAKTVKGWGMGASGEAQNKTHQTKKMTVDDLKAFRDRFTLPLTDEQVERLTFYKPAEDSEVLEYLHRKRRQLGGYLPARRSRSDHTLPVPSLDIFETLLSGSGTREISSTMAFVRCLAALLKDPGLKDHIVPILADESRTFGMEGLFRQIGIYAPFGQVYTPEDQHELMYYREDQKGQLLQQGINEAGAMASWIAAATAYSHSNVQMIPFYIYYSMFGFQRFGDFAWAAGDMRSRGFILGGTAGKTTLAGEGLQHQDGHNILMFDVVPNCVCYDPTFSYEIAVILHEGLKRMVERQEDVYYYITLMNENYVHPPMPTGVEMDILKGMYCLRSAEVPDPHKHVQLMGSGTLLCETMKAASVLEADYGVTADVWSVTSFTELYRECRSALRLRTLHPDREIEMTHVETCLEGKQGPVVAVSDYIHLYADQIRSCINQPYYVLGTDGFGRSDTREALRDHFEVNVPMIVYTALKALYDQGGFEQAALLKARAVLGIDPDRKEPISH